MWEVKERKKKNVKYNFLEFNVGKRENVFFIKWDRKYGNIN